MDRDDSLQQKVFTLAHEEIDPDLDGRLDATVFYSDNVSSQRQKHNRRSNERNSVCKGDKSSAFYLTRPDLSKEDLRFQNCSEETRIDELDDHFSREWKNSLCTELVFSGSETDFEGICDDIESTNFSLCKSIYKKTVTEFNDDRKADLKKDKQSPRSNIMKERTSWQSKFDSDEKLGDAAVSFENNVANILVEEPNESSDVKTEGELEKINSSEKATRISLFRTATFIPEKYSDVSVISKPEEVPEESRLARIVSTDKYSAEVTTCGSERDFEDHCEIIETRFPASSPPVVEMTSSSSSDDEDWRETNQRKVEKPVAEECSDVVTINDSEDSICEIPVPPKPEPPTVYLEDSSDSTASGSDAEYSETASARKSSPSICIHDTDLGDTSESRGGTSEGEKEFQSDVMGSEMSKNKNLPSSSDGDSSKPKGSENLSGDFSLESSGGSSLGSRRSCRAVEKVGKTVAEESPGSREMASSVTSPGPKKSCDAAIKLLSAIEQTVLKNDRQKNCSGETGQTIVEDGALILNVAEANRSPDLVDNGEGETRTKTRENRKRSIIDSGKKSSQSSPAKRARDYDDRAEAATSSGKSSKENKENRDKTRNCAADYFFQPMSSEMKDFYNNSWGGETFDVDALKKQMPRDPRQWSISTEDLLGSPRRRPRYWSQMKCRNCDESGHSAAECTKDKKVPSCHMCGVSGHREPRCPYKQCLGCGQKQKTYTQVCNGCSRVWCSGCQSLGHSADSCPDLWRRYHLTTSITDVNTDLSFADVMKPQRSLYCCNCAKRGHDSANCISYRWSRHFPTPAHVTNYTTGPVYENDFAPDVESFPPYEADGRPIAETQATDGVSSLQATPKRSSGKHERKKRDKKTSERPAVDRNVGELEEAIERLKNRIEAEESRQPSTANSEPTKNRNVAASLKFESKLLTQATKDSDDFEVFRVLPPVPQLYENFVDCDSTRQFMKNLTEQFPVNIEIVRTKNGEMELFISTTKACHRGASQLIRNWLEYPVDERSRFVNFNLPTKKEELVKLIASKLDELDKDLGDPVELYSKVKTFKNNLRTIQMQMNTGKKSASIQKRTRVVDQLANSQCRLNMILFGQTKNGVPPGSQKYLRKALLEMQRDNSSSQVDPSKYFQIVVHYNKIFAAYTPKQLKSTIRQYKQTTKEKRKAKKPRIKDFEKFPPETYVRFLKSLSNEKVNPNRETNPSSSSISPKVSSGKTDCGSRRYFNCNVENQFQPHSPILRIETNRKPDTDSHRPKPQAGTRHNSAKGENNYYRSKYDFGDSSKYRTHRGSAVPKNLEQNDYIPLDSSPRDSEKTPDNFYGDLSYDSRPFDQNEDALRDRGNEEANVGVGEMFYFEERAGSSRDFGHNSGGVSPWTEVTSTRADREPRDTRRRPDQRNVAARSRRKVANKKRGAKLPRLVQERVAAKVDKYSNFGHVDVVQAATSIQKDVKKNSLTMFRVNKFENLLKRVSGITDRLL